MDEYTARRLADALNIGSERLRYLPENVERLEQVALRLEWAVENLTRQADRLEALAQEQARG